MKICHENQYVRFCIPILYVPWPWWKWPGPDPRRWEDVMPRKGEPDPIPWIEGPDFKLEVVKDLRTLAGIEELVHQLETPEVKDAVMEGLRNSIGRVGVPSQFKISLDEAKPPSRTAA